MVEDPWAALRPQVLRQYQQQQQGKAHPSKPYGAVHSPPSDLKSNVAGKPPTALQQGMHQQASAAAGAASAATPEAAPADSCSGSQQRRPLEGGGRQHPLSSSDTALDPAQGSNDQQQQQQKSGPSLAEALAEAMAGIEVRHTTIHALTSQPSPYTGVCRC